MVTFVNWLPGSDPEIEANAKLKGSVRTYVRSMSTRESPSLSRFLLFLKIQPGQVGCVWTMCAPTQWPKNQYWLCQHWRFWLAFKPPNEERRAPLTNYQPITENAWTDWLTHSLTCARLVQWVSELVHFAGKLAPLASTILVAPFALCQMSPSTWSTLFLDERVISTRRIRAKLKWKLIRLWIWLIGKTVSINLLTEQSMHMKEPFLEFKLTD